MQPFFATTEQLDAMSDAALNAYIANAESAVTDAKKLKKKRSLNVELEDNLPQMIGRAIVEIEKHLLLPQEKQGCLDIPIIGDGGSFVDADIVNARADYRNAVAALAEKYGAKVRIYQGYTTSYSYAGNDSKPDARLEITFDKGPPAVTDAVAEILAKARG